MVDDVKDITETAESKVASEALDRARLARERREAEQRKRLDELRAHAAAAQAQREKRDEERRRRQAEQRARDDDRRQQVEERKRAIWEASISRREALLQRERDRTERLERTRAARSAPRPAFAFGSSTPRLLEPIDSAGFFWAARRAASTTNVMFASAPLTRRASALQLDSDTDNKDDGESGTVGAWSSVARRRTDLVPTLPARAPGRAQSMTRLDHIPARPMYTASPSMLHLNRAHIRSGETTPGSRPGSAMSNSNSVVRRTSSAPRKPRPASIAGTGVNTPRAPVLSPGEGKPPLHRKPKPPKDQDKTPRGKSVSLSPRRALSPSPLQSKDSSVDKEVVKKPTTPSVPDKNQVSAIEVTQKLEALQIINSEQIDVVANVKENEINDSGEVKSEPKPEQITLEENKQNEKINDIEKRESSQEKVDDSEMTGSMTGRRITTEEEAKAALAERRRRARDQLERQAELERARLQREAEEEAERQRQEEERQRREEEEARELARLQREQDEEKLRRAIEAQQKLEREEAERKAREEAERQARLKEEEEKRKAAEEAEKLRREEAEREEKERLARKQRVEAIMARTRLKKAEEDKKQQESKDADKNLTPSNNGNHAQNAAPVSEEKSLNTNDMEVRYSPHANTGGNPSPNGNVTADLLGLSEQNNSMDTMPGQTVATKLDITTNTNALTLETNNGNVGHISANFIQTERVAAELSQSKMADNGPKLIEDDFTSHNGHSAAHNRPLTVQNAI